MPGHAVGHEVRQEDALVTADEAVARGLAHDGVAGRPAVSHGGVVAQGVVRRRGSDAVDLLAHGEQEAHAPLPLLHQLLRCQEHRQCLTLRIARSAAVDRAAGDPRTDERRDRVQVRAENDLRATGPGKHVPAAGRDLLVLHVEAALL